MEEFQRFCDRVGEQAIARGLDEDKLKEILRPAEVLRIERLPGRIR